MCVCVCVHVLINFIDEWFDVVSAYSCCILQQSGRSVNFHYYYYQITACSFVACTEVTFWSCTACWPPCRPRWKKTNKDRCFCLTAFCFAFYYVPFHFCTIFFATDACCELKVFLFKCYLFFTLLRDFLLLHTLSCCLSILHGQVWHYINSFTRYCINLQSPQTYKIYLLLCSVNKKLHVWISAYTKHYLYPAYPCA